MESVSLFLMNLALVLGINKSEPVRDIHENLFEPRWFNVVSWLRRCDCRLAVELDVEGNILRACPWDYRNPRQQWRWDGRMIKSRVNGKVWRRSHGVIYAAHALRHVNRQWVTFVGDPRIYLDDEVLNYSSVVDLIYVPPRIGQRIFTFGQSGNETQHFEFNYNGVSSCCR